MSCVIFPFTLLSCFQPGEASPITLAPSTKTQVPAAVVDSVAHEEQQQQSESAHVYASSVRKGVGKQIGGNKRQSIL